jgi:2-hydroxy-3-oxopropionate reductase
MKIGFIGLGIMGKPMCKNLLKAGYEITAYDIFEKAVDEVVECGAARGTSNADVASKSDVIITMLPNSPHVKTAVLGEGGIIEGAKPGLVIVDMSSISPIASKEICETVEEKGCFFIDAPVSGGEPKAIDGTLAIMVGGRKEIFDKASELLDIMGGSVTHCGEIGAGNTTKLVNQIIVAVNIAAVSEALVFGKKAGVDPEAIYQAIRGGLAGSTVLDAKAPMMFDGNFNPGFRIDLHIKDLTNVLDTGHDVGASLPLSASVMEMMQWLKSKDLDKEDHSSLVKYFENLSGIDIRK